MFMNMSLNLTTCVRYGSLILFHLTILYYSIRCWEILNRRKRMAILIFEPVLLVISMIAVLEPESLCIIVYVLLILAGLVVGKENAEKYLDKQTGMYNQYGLETVCSEYFARQRKVCLLVVALSEAEEVWEIRNWKRYADAMKKMGSFCRQTLKQRPYRVGGNGFVLPVRQGRTAKQEIQVLEDYVAKQYEGEIAISYKIVNPDGYSEVNEVLSDVLEFCTGEMNKMATHDFLTKVYNRNSYEKEIAQLKQDGRDAFCFLIDLNNLKNTNDELGHSAGDELLQTLAKVLKKTAGKDGRVFRYGGDEFVVLWTGEDAGQFLTELEQTSHNINRERKVPLKFAVGYGRVLDEEGIMQADRMMYENKKQMKAKKM
ncbi:MAG: GGDEF domain-containing protein [Lachnospiraceae bacterium]